MRLARYRTALGSARETMSCLLVAERFGYVEPMPAALLSVPYSREPASVMPTCVG